MQRRPAHKMTTVNQKFEAFIVMELPPSIEKEVDFICLEDFIQKVKSQIEERGIPPLFDPVSTRDVPLLTTLTEDYLLDIKVREAFERETKNCFIARLIAAYEQVIDDYVEIATVEYNDYVAQLHP